MTNTVCPVTTTECEVLQDLGRYCDTLQAFAEVTNSPIHCPACDEHITLHECHDMRRTTEKVLSLIA